MAAYGGISQIFDSIIYGALCGNAAHEHCHCAWAPKGNDGMAVLFARRGFDSVAIDDGYPDDLCAVSTCGQSADGGGLPDLLPLLPEDC